MLRQFDFVMTPPQFKHRQREQALRIRVAAFLIGDQLINCATVEQTFVGLTENAPRIFTPIAFEPTIERQRKIPVCVSNPNFWATTSRPIGATKLSLHWAWREKRRARGKTRTQ